MARRLNRQQAARIQRLHDERRQKADQQAQLALDESVGEARLGTVVVRHGKQVVVADDNNNIVTCLFRQNIGHVVCGDRVVWHQVDEHNGVVSALEQRFTVLARPDYSGREKPIAANITQIVIIIAPRPEPTGYLVDQYLVAAELIGTKATILLNKCDLLDDSPESLAIAQQLKDYHRIGYKTLSISAKKQVGLEQLDKHFADETSILVGQSGVGKSSLINRLIPDQDVQTGAISKVTGLGRHTTSTTTLYRLHKGGRIIDSPGVRSFRLNIDSRAQLEAGFRDFTPFLGHCRFKNCSHTHEPGCALLDARDSGKITTWRLEHFQQMAAGLEK